MLLNTYSLFLIIFFAKLTYEAVAMSVLSEADSTTEASTTEYTRGEDYLITILYQENIDQNKTTCNCNHTTKHLPKNYRQCLHKNIEQIIKMQLQDSLATITNSKYDIIRDIEETADLIILQLSINTKQIIEKVETAVKEKRLHEFIENINNRVSMLENTDDNTTENSTASSLEYTRREEYLETIMYQGNIDQNNCNNSRKNLRKNIEGIIRTQLQASLANISDSLYDINKDIQETSDLLILQISISTRQITEKVDSAVKEKRLIDYIKNINDRVTMLETKKNATNNDTKMQNKNINTLCDLIVPSDIQINKDIWQLNTLPQMDDLDRFMVNRTGCTYHVYDRYSGYTMPDVTYDGTLFEWRGAARARSDAVITITWNRTEGYTFDIGDEKNTITKMYNWYTLKQINQLTSPGLLSQDRYVLFYIKIQSGTLTLGTECDSKPLHALDVSIEQGMKVVVSLTSDSLYGTKWLYCPAT